MTLRDWVASRGGRAKVARALGVTHGAVHRWLHAETSPRTVTAMKIVELSGGKVSFEQIVRETTLKGVRR